MAFKLVIYRSSQGYFGKGFPPNMIVYSLSGTFGFAVPLRLINQY